MCTSTVRKSMCVLPRRLKVPHPGGHVSTTRHMHPSMHIPVTQPRFAAKPARRSVGCCGAQKRACRCDCLRSCRARSQGRGSQKQGCTTGFAPEMCECGRQNKSVERGTVCALPWSQPKGVCVPSVTGRVCLCHRDLYFTVAA